MLPKTSAYVKSYDGQTKWMCFLSEDDDLLKKYNNIWDKVSADIKKEFDSEPVYNKKFLKTKMKSYGDESTGFHDKEIPKAGFDHISLAVITINSLLFFEGSILIMPFMRMQFSIMSFLRMQFLIISFLRGKFC